MSRAVDLRPSPGYRTEEPPEHPPQASRFGGHSIFLQQRRDGCLCSICLFVPVLIIGAPPCSSRRVSSFFAVFCAKVTVMVAIPNRDKYRMFSLSRSLQKRARRSDNRMSSDSRESAAAARPACLLSRPGKHPYSGALAGMSIPRAQPRRVHPEGREAVLPLRSFESSNGQLFLKRRLQSLYRRYYLRLGL